jgi:septal ring factor EnvC (AmiA/AmiB activator)
MKVNNQRVLTLVLALLVTSSMFIAGCSSKPDAEQMRQLNSLKEEYAALQREVASKEQAKATLERETADKNAKLKKCNDDQQIVKQRLAK